MSTELMPPNESENSSPKDAWWKKRDVRQVAVLTVIFTALIGFVSNYVQNGAMQDPASSVMDQTVRLMTLFTWAAAPVAGLVAALVVVTIAKRHHHGDNPPEEAEITLRQSTRANATWLVVSSLLCLFALVTGLYFIQKDNEAIFEENAIEIQVVGNQWAWNYNYEGTNGVRSEVLHLPVNRPVIFHVTSVDVKHSFWIVEMGIKVDANPGYITNTAVTPDREGVFTVRCAELCGLLHSYMQNKVIVESEASFRNWLESQPNTAGDGTQEQGEETPAEGGN